jgi:hypothetical protein
MTDVRVEVFLENFLVEMETVDTLGVDQAFKKKKKTFKNLIIQAKRYLFALKGYGRWRRSTVRPFCIFCAQNVSHKQKTHQTRLNGGKL